MDFKGETPRQAVAQLKEFLRELALVENSSLPGVHINANGAQMSWVKRKLGLTSYGSGYLLFAASSARLKLLCDEEGYYRWHRIAGRRGILRRVVPAHGAHWFPLLDIYLQELASAELRKTEKVLTMNVER